MKAKTGNNISVQVRTYRPALYLTHSPRSAMNAKPTHVAIFKSNANRTGFRVFIMQ